MGYAVRWQGHSHDYSQDMKNRAEIAKIAAAQQLDLQSCRCPCCRGKLKIDARTIQCQNFDCGFRMNRKIAGVNLGVNDVIDVLYGRQTRLIEGFYSSKKNKFFNAALKFDRIKRMVTFVFS